VIADQLHQLRVRRAVGKVRRGVLRLGDIEGEGSVIELAAGANALLVPERLDIGAVYTTLIASRRKS
jgi:hypothetical protein